MEAEAIARLQTKESLEAAGGVENRGVTNKNRASCGDHTARSPVGSVWFS
jgi:hypothetical protein